MRKDSYERLHDINKTPIVDGDDEEEDDVIARPDGGNDSKEPALPTKNDPVLSSITNKPILHLYL